MVCQDASQYATSRGVKLTSGSKRCLTTRDGRLSHQSIPYVWYILPVHFVLLSTIIVSHACDTLPQKCLLHPTLPQAPTVHAGPEWRQTRKSKSRPNTLALDACKRSSHAPHPHLPDISRHTTLTIALFASAPMAFVRSDLYVNYNPYHLSLT